jgi:hypothetical protein
MHPKALGACTVEQEPPPPSTLIVVSRLDSIPGPFAVPKLDNKDSAVGNPSPLFLRSGEFAHGIDPDSRWYRCQ